MEQIRDIVTRATSAATRDERIEAYGRLVEQFRDMACGYAYALLGDFHLAEDMAQEAFILAFEKLAQLDRPEAFPGWFRRIVSTRCGHLTRQKAVPMVALDDAAGLPAEAVPPLAGMEQREMRDEVLKAIRQLPAEQREVTTLFYINGYSQNDIADFLEVPVGTVKNRLSASRSRLKERMMNMVEQTLHQNAPDDRFKQAVLLKLPKMRDSEPTSHLPDTLDEFQARLILSAVPDGAKIVELTPATWYYRYPLVANCRLVDGQDTAVELFVYPNEVGATPREIQLLPVLAELGLPVQKVLAGPATHPQHPEVGPMAVLSHLPGKNVLWLKKSAEEIDLSIRLLIKGIRRLREFTEPLRRHPVGKVLPERTLVGELDAIIKRGGPWMKVPVFRNAVSRLRPALEAVAAPLVFSNGSNMMQNFLCDGDKLIGFQWLTEACFEDPHIQFVKYKLNAHDSIGWGLYDRAGLVERYLYDQDVSRSQFAPRVVLGCLSCLQGMAVERDNDKPDTHRDVCLAALEDSLRLIGAH